MTFLLTGAPNSKWQTDSCRDLFEDRIHDPLELFASVGLHPHSRSERRYLFMGLAPPGSPAGAAWGHGEETDDREGT